MTTLTGDMFREFVGKHRFIVVHFFAKWNGYDQKMQQLLDSQIPIELKDQIKFERIDIDIPENWEICRQHKLLEVPFLALYSNGSLIETLSGNKELETIIEHLQSLIKNEDP